ncbi:uncharacterized protein LOC100376034 [Saccoglossus kowalevskii]|uniref:Uncharacterized protein LOC100376034 n=1 Tax=Saccoglossus kowalevskii TaxID=10224 RepID=A0ABM0GYY4_SACKO|nr:PREDICTED: uncharacterized protein LOC100376034 [Saccoglossus kowalevskii]
MTITSINMASSSLRNICFLLLVCCASLTPTKSAEVKCTKTGPCSCEMSDGSGVIDLKRVGNAGKPMEVDARFIHVKAVDANSYSYNPCWSFEEVGCHSVAICQRVPDRRAALYFTLGTHDKSDFYHNGTHVILTYEGLTGTSQVVRTSHITLVCNKENDDTLFIPYGEDPWVKPLHYYYDLISPHSCPGKHEET